eukprot:scaffold62153_cov61-Phaeocystis_antarctica.AAC.3
MGSTRRGRPCATRCRADSARPGRGLGLVLGWRDVVEIAHALAEARQWVLGSGQWALGGGHCCGAIGQSARHETLRKTRSTTTTTTATTTTTTTTTATTTTTTTTITTTTTTTTPTLRKTGTDRSPSHTGRRSLRPRPLPKARLTRVSSRPTWGPLLVRGSYEPCVAYAAADWQARPPHPLPPQRTDYHHIS